MFKWLRKEKKQEAKENQEEQVRSLLGGRLLDIAFNRNYKEWDPNAGLTETYEINGKAIEVRKMPLDRKCHMEPQDTLRLEIDNYVEDIHLTRDFPIDRHMVADEAFVFVLEDELGYKTCMIGGFGEIGN